MAIFHNLKFENGPKIKHILACNSLGLLGKQTKFSKWYVLLSV